jgi:hypothetical protein
MDLKQQCPHNINLYMDTNRLHELLQTRRLSFYDDCFGINRLNGLYDLIKKHVRSDFRVVEIGSFEGKSTELFSMFCKTVYAIDPYEAYVEIDMNHIKNAEHCFDNMVSNIKNINKIKKRSLDAVKDFDDHSLDLVYIDGQHDYVNVKNDILAWIPKIKHGGIISGHDYSHNNDVVKAVNEIFPKHVVEIYADSSWSVVLDDYHKHDIFIVSCYPNTEQKQNLLNDTVLKLKKLNKHVLIASHYPVPDYIVKNADYYIYDAYNMLDHENRTLEKTGCSFWTSNQYFIAQSTAVHHASALSRIFNISMEFIKILGYKMFTIIESDAEYDLEDLKKFDVYKNNIIVENKSLFFFKTRYTEFNIKDECLYETYCFGGFLEKFLEIFQFPRTFNEWSMLLSENENFFCLEYLLTQKFKNHEKNFLILGTLRSEFVNSKIDLCTVNDYCSGVYYNTNDKLRPILLLMNNDGFVKNYIICYLPLTNECVTLNPGCWWYIHLDIENYNSDVSVQVYNDEDVLVSTFSKLVTKENVEELRKYKIITFN